MPVNPSANTAPAVVVILYASAVFFNSADNTSLANLSAFSPPSATNSPALPRPNSTAPPIWLNQPCEFNNSLPKPSVALLAKLSVPAVASMAAFITVDDNSVPLAPTCSCLTNWPVDLVAVMARDLPNSWADSLIN